MSGAAYKRRRLDNNSNVLFKPFKSPMKLVSPESTSEGNNSTQQLDNNQHLGSRTASEVRNPDRDTARTSTVPTWTLPRPSAAAVKPHPTSLITSQISNELTCLRREESRLLAMQSKLKVSLDQIKQARGIEESGRDAELLNLATAWRSASQQAAEEVYAIMRDKVNADGGMKRWREMEKARMENSYSNWGTEIEERKKTEGDDDEGGNEERDETEDGSTSVNEELNEQRHEEDQTRPDESESFSMDVMLRYLNIQLDVIGYDEQGQRWST